MVPLCHTTLPLQSSQGLHKFQVRLPAPKDMLDLEVQVRNAKSVQHTKLQIWPSQGDYIVLGQCH
jgi:hypothetical protein